MFQWKPQYVTLVIVLVIIASLAASFSGAGFTWGR